MANRRIVKVRKTASTTTTPSSNPFAAIQLVLPANTSTPAVTTTEAGNGTTTTKKPEDSNDQSEGIKKEETDVSKEANHEKESDKNSKLPESKSESTADANVDKEKVDNPNEPNKPESTEKKAVGSEKIKDDTETVTVVEKSADDIEVEGNKTENEMEKHVGDGKNDKDAETASFGSFQQLSSSQNAFTGLAGTGFANTTFSFGANSKEGSPLGFGSESGAGSGSGSLFGAKSDQSIFGISLPTNGNASLFGYSGSSSVKKSEGTGFPSMQEVPIVTGEEHEKAIFTADSVLFEYLNGGWKERGKGELKLNISSGTGKARLVMRTRGNYRLILNANLYPEMKLASMDKKGVTFACLNSADDGKDGLSTIALKFKDASIIEEFRAAVMEHKDKIEVSLKTPPNSP